MKSMTKQFALPILLCSVLLLPVGCQGNTTGTPEGTVHGKVTVDGNPVTEGVVRFSSAELGVNVTGEITANGSYQLAGNVPVGEYKVAVMGPETTPDNPTPKPTPIPQKYWNEKTSEIALSITNGNSSHNLELKSP